MSENAAFIFTKTVAIALAFALAFLLCLPAPAAFAVTSEEKQAEADEIMAQIDQLQTQLNEAYDEYDKANAAYEQATAEYDKANAEHEEAVAKMEEAEAVIAEQTSRIESLQQDLGDYSVTMYKYNDRASFIDVLLGSQSFDDFLTAWDSMSAISSEGASIVARTKDAREKTEEAKATYEEQSKVAEDSMETAESSMNTAQQSMATADATVKRIEATQASLKAEAEKITGEVAELHAQEEAQAEAARAAERAAAAAAQSQAAIDSGYIAPSGDNASGSGVFAHPLPSGTISSTFGYRTFDNSFHKGLDLAAPEGTPYYAADSGTVIYATNDGGYNGGAGNWVVISHGNGIVTKYMHSSATYVSVGQRVERGQVIGAVGNTGASFGAHLHFQVEVNGTAVNPLGFL